MRALREKLSRKKVRGAWGVFALGAPLALVVLATEFPSGIVPGVGGSMALAELIARSPGARVGGVALKAKAPLSALAPLAGVPGPGAGATPQSGLSPVPGPASPVAVVLPATGAAFPGTTPAIVLPDFTGPAAGGGGLAGPSVGGVPFIPGGAGIFIPGIPGGGGGSAPGGEVPGGGTAVIPPPPPPPVAAVPEPSVWLMMIIGFGALGRAMRRRQRACPA